MQLRRLPPPVRISQPFLLTQVIVGINVLVFVGMVFSGVSPMSPTQLQLVIVGRELRAFVSRDRSPGGCSPRITFTSGSSTFFSTCGACGTWAGWRSSIFDRWTYLLIYTASGIAGSLASLWWHPQGIGAGASGAIFGLAGGLIAVLYLGKLPFAKEALKPTLRSLVMFAAYNLFFGLVPGIDNAAHLGGLAAGLAIGAVLAASVTEPPDIRARRRNYVVIGTTVLLLAGYSYVKQKSGPVAPQSDLILLSSRPERSAASGVERTCCVSGADADQRNRQWARVHSRRLSGRSSALLAPAATLLREPGTPSGLSRAGLVRHD